MGLVGEGEGSNAEGGGSEGVGHDPGGEQCTE